MSVSSAAKSSAMFTRWSLRLSPAAEPIALHGSFRATVAQATCNSTISIIGSFSFFRLYLYVIVCSWFIHSVMIVRLLQWEPTVCMMFLEDCFVTCWKTSLSNSFYWKTKSRFTCLCSASPRGSLSLSLLFPFSTLHSLSPPVSLLKGSLCGMRFVNLSWHFSVFLCYFRLLFSRLSQRSRAEPNIRISKSFPLIAERSQKRAQFLTGVCLFESVFFFFLCWAAVFFNAGFSFLLQLDVEGLRRCVKSLTTSSHGGWRESGLILCYTLLTSGNRAGHRCHFELTLPPRGGSPDVGARMRIAAGLHREFHLCREYFPQMFAVCLSADGNS